MSGLLDFRFPNPGSNNVGTNSDKIRANTEFVEELAMFAGEHPDYEIAFTYSGGNLTQVDYTEITAAATARGRASGTRIFGREILTYSGSNLQKIRRRISYDSGATFADWVGHAGFDFANYNYTGSDLTSITRSAT
jgi:hypothetical protein